MARIFDRRIGLGRSGQIQYVVVGYTFRCIWESSSELHVCNTYLNILIILIMPDNGKIYVQLIEHKRAEYVMVLCNPCRCKYFLNGKRFSLIFTLLRRFIGEDSNFQS